LLDADNTLFDFDLDEHKALGLTLAGHGIPFTPEAEQTYIDINTALWSKFDRGEISRGALVVEQIFLLPAGRGPGGRPGGAQRYYLSRLGSQGDLLPGAEALCRALAARWHPGHHHQRRLFCQRGRFAAVRFRTAFLTFLFRRTLDSTRPRREFSTPCSTIWAFPTGRAVVGGDTHRVRHPGGQERRPGRVWYNPRAARPPDLSPVLIAANFDQIEKFILDRGV
jgi:2-haloacid dehalogenase